MHGGYAIFEHMLPELSVCVSCELFLVPRLVASVLIVTFLVTVEADNATFWSVLCLVAWTMKVVITAVPRSVKSQLSCETYNHILILCASWTSEESPESLYEVCLWSRSLSLYLSICPVLSFT